MSSSFWPDSFSGWLFEPHSSDSWPGSRATWKRSCGSHLSGRRVLTWAAWQRNGSCFWCGRSFTRTTVRLRLNCPQPGCCWSERLLTRMRGVWPPAVSWVFWLYFSGMFSYMKDSRCHWFSSWKCDNCSEFQLVGTVSFPLKPSVSANSFSFNLCWGHEFS